VKKDFPTKFAQIAAGSIDVDYSYQRPLDKWFVKKKLGEFDPDAFGVIHVSMRSNGAYYVIDGNHRVHFALAQGEDWSRQNLPCIVYTGLTVEQEAYLFRKLNESHQVRAFSRFRAALAAKDPDAVAIYNIVKENGFVIGSGPGQLRCVTSFERIYAGLRAVNAAAGPANLKRTMRVVSSSFGHAAPHPDGSVILGIGMFLERYHERVDEQWLVEKLEKSGWRQLVGKAFDIRKREGGSTSLALFNAVLTTYNYGRRPKQKLNSLYDDPREAE